METPTDLNQELATLQKEIHTLAKEKGWYDDRDMSDPDVVDAMVELIHSEISEATECVRRGEMALCFWEPTFQRREQHQNVCGSLLKPVGFPSELADVVIRCLDLAEALGEDLHIEAHHAVDCSTPLKIAARLRAARYELEDASPVGERPGRFALESCAEWMFDIARALDIDLLEVIKLKHAYNKTRPYRHGGKAL